MHKYKDVLALTVDLQYTLTSETEVSEVTIAVFVYSFGSWKCYTINMNSGYHAFIFCDCKQ